MSGTFDPQIAQAARKKTRRLDVVWNALGVIVPLAAVAIAVPMLTGGNAMSVLSLPDSVQDVVGSIPPNNLEPYMARVVGVKDPQQKAALAALLYVEAEATAARQSANPSAMAMLGTMRLDLEAERQKLKDELIKTAALESEIRDLKNATGGTSGGGDGGSRRELERLRALLKQVEGQRDAARADVQRIQKLLDACENKPTFSAEEHERVKREYERTIEDLNRKLAQVGDRQPVDIRRLRAGYEAQIAELKKQIAELERRPPSEGGDAAEVRARYEKLVATLRARIAELEKRGGGGS